MMTLDKCKKIVILLILLPTLLAIGNSAEAGVIDTFWTIVYWVGDSLSKTSVGQFLERGFDGFIGLFGVHFTGYVTPDYWGALTGTYSKEIGSSIPLPGRNKPFICKVFEPRMSRISTSSRWDFDESTKSYLNHCYQQAKELLSKSAKNFSS
jgi:hypothetical protein